MNKRFAKTGIALGGGAAKGLAHIGALKALKEAGIIPSYITGTSAGALIGGLYAAGVSIAEMENIVSKLSAWEFSKLVDLTWSKGSLVAGNAVTEFLTKILGDVRIENLNTPFIAVAVDLNTGRGQYFDKGSLVDAIRASISFPGVFEPVAANGTLFIDGGVRLNLPLRALDQFQPKLRIGVGLTKSSRYNANWVQGAIECDGNQDDDDQRNFLQRLKDRFSGEPNSEVGGVSVPDINVLLARSFNTLMAEADRLEVERTHPDLFINLDLSVIELWEFWRGTEAAELGYFQSKIIIEQFLQDRKFFRRIKRFFFQCETSPSSQ